MVIEPDQLEFCSLEDWTVDKGRIYCELCNHNQTCILHIRTMDKDHHVTFCPRCLKSPPNEIHDALAISLKNDQQYIADIVIPGNQAYVSDNNCGFKFSVVDGYLVIDNVIDRSRRIIQLK